jgi:hypothetical protein
VSSPTVEQVARKLVRLITKHGERPIVVEGQAADLCEPDAGPSTTVCLRGVSMSAFRIDLLSFDASAFPFDADEALFAWGDQIVSARRFTADDLQATVVEAELLATVGTDPVVMMYLQWRAPERAARLLVSVAEQPDDERDDDVVPLTWDGLEPILWAALGRPFPETWQDV